MKRKKIGLFGGSFNPVHLGHLAAAQSAKEQLKLDEVVFMPCAKSAYRKKILEDNLRLRCLRSALRGRRTYRVSDLEIRRGGVSRTVETLRILVAKNPAHYFLLLGADQALEFGSWKLPGEISKLCKVVSLTRLGFKPSSAVMKKWDILPIDIPQYEISSTKIRKRLIQKKDISWMVPPNVVRELTTHKI